MAGQLCCHIPGGRVGPCGPCTVTSDTWRIVASGFANTPCLNCTGFNGTFDLPFVADCRWETVAAGGCPAGTSEPNWKIEIISNTLRATNSAQYVYEATHPAWHCNCPVNPDSLTLVSSPGIPQCSAVPSSILANALDERSILGACCCAEGSSDICFAPSKYKLTIPTGTVGVPSGEFTLRYKGRNDLHGPGNICQECVWQTDEFTNNGVTPRGVLEIPININANCLCGATGFRTFGLTINANSPFSNCHFFFRCQPCCKWDRVNFTGMAGVGCTTFETIDAFIEPLI